MNKFMLNTGFEIPLVGRTYLIKGTEFTKKVVDDALSAGYRLFDTAQNYSNEQCLGAAFKELLPKHNLTRNDIFITSKFVLKGCLTTEDDYLNVVKETLRNLQVDYIDLMLIHEPGVEGISNTSTDVITYRLAAWKALKKFKQQELIRSIGVSNFLIRHLESLKSELDVVPAVNQVEYHPMNYDLELLDYCKTNQILLQAHSVLGTTGNSSIRNNNLVSAIARDLNKSSVQILLKWALQRQVGVIPKASSRNHLKENIELNFEIPLEQMKLLDNLKNDYFMRLDIDPNEVI